MSHRIHDLPTHDRPRERLLRLGPASLTDAELLAIFINTGVRGENAIQVAARLLREHQNLRGLSREDADLLARHRGIGPAKAAHLAAAFELGRRAERQSMTEQPLDRPELVYQFLAAELQALHHEVMRVLLLNTKLCFIRQEQVSQGTLNETSAHPREILKKAIAHSAYAFVVVHNHPSGDPTPSDADRRLTRRLREVAEIMGIVFVDHVIIGSRHEARPQAYFSFKEAGML